jgi:uncharacterized membrane protein
MKSYRYRIPALAFILMIQFSCSKENTNPVTPPAGGGGNSTCSTAIPGSLFKEVKNLLTNNCVTCHKPGGQQPNPNFQDNCVIQANAALIKTRAVDLGTMPPTGPLSQSDKDKITNWVAAGGKVSD